MGTIRQMVERFELKCNALGTERRDALIFWHRRSRSAEEHTPAREIAGRGGGANLSGQHAPEDATITSYGLSVSAECVAQARRSGTFLVHPVPASSSRPRGSATARKAINRIAAVAGQREESRLKERMAKAVAAALQSPRDLELDAGLPQPPIADVRCAHRRQAAARDDLGREPSV
jgi:hypothetical protein